MDTVSKQIEWLAYNSSDEVLLRQIAEECMELGQACLKAIRALNDDEYVSATYDDIFENLVEEIADVKNSVEVYKCKADIDDSVISNISETKIDRWYNRIAFMD